MLMLENALQWLRQYCVRNVVGDGGDEGRIEDGGDSDDRGNGDDGGDDMWRPDGDGEFFFGVLVCSSLFFAVFLPGIVFNRYRWGLWL